MEHADTCQHGLSDIFSDYQKHCTASGTSATSAGSWDGVTPSDPRGNGDPAQGAASSHERFGSPLLGGVTDVLPGKRRVAAFQAQPPPPGQFSLESCSP